jgi:hypothetical protein
MEALAEIISDFFNSIDPKRTSGRHPNNMSRKSRAALSECYSRARCDCLGLDR